MHAVATIARDCYRVICLYIVNCLCMLKFLRRICALPLKSFKLKVGKIN